MNALALMVGVMLTDARPMVPFDPGSGGSKLGRVSTPVGERFGRLVVLAEGERYLPDARGRRIRRWVCRCDCGTQRLFSIYNIRRGTTQSCGCTAGLSSRFTKERNPNARHA